MRLTCVVILFVLSACAFIPDAGAASGWSNIALGATLGDPQALALTLETHQAGPVRLQSSFFTIIVISAFTSRVVLIRPTGTWLPYGFAGGGFHHAVSGEWSVPTGITVFVWGGVGLRCRLGPLSLFGERGFYEDKYSANDGYEGTQSAWAFGLLYDF
jgi:hypothetical protein